MYLISESIRPQGEVFPESQPTRAWVGAILLVPNQDMSEIISLLKGYYFTEDGVGG